MCHLVLNPASSLFLNICIIIYSNKTEKVLISTFVCQVAFKAVISLFLLWVLAFFRNTTHFWSSSEVTWLCLQKRIKNQSVCQVFWYSSNLYVVPQNGPKWSWFQTNQPCTHNSLNQSINQSLNQSYVLKHKKQVLNYKQLEKVNGCIETEILTWEKESFLCWLFPRLRPVTKDTISK
mgnify:CR=1 FL=1